MTVVVTPNIGLTEPEVNVSTGWGGTLNTNFTIIDSIFAANGTGASVGLNVGSGKTLVMGGTAILGTNDGTASAASATVRGAAKTGSNAIGPNVLIQAGNGTGSGGSGSILFQTAPAAASSTSPNSMRTALEVRSTGVVSAPYGLEVAGSNINNLVAPSGAVMAYAGGVAPTGWLFCDGSGQLAATYPNLFAAIGYTYGGGGASFNLPDLRGRIPAGRDNMGGNSAGRITNGGSGIVGTTLGAAGGQESVTLSISQIPAHTHSYAWYQGSGGGGKTDGGGLTSGTTGSAGGGQAHTNVQPTIILNYIIKT